MPKPSAEEIANQNDRTTALGLIGRAVEHYAAAAVVFDALGDKQVIWTPSGRTSPCAPDSANHLLAMSIEVAFKAFLRERMLDVFEIKTKYGHDLVKLLDRSEKEGLGGTWTPNDRALLLLLNEMFLRREFEFTVTGSRTVPTYESVCGIACQVFEAAFKAIPTSRNFLNGRTGAYLLRDLQVRTTI